MVQDGNTNLLQGSVHIEEISDDEEVVEISGQGPIVEEPSDGVWRKMIKYIVVHSILKHNQRQMHC